MSAVIVIQAQQTQQALESKAIACQGIEQSFNNTSIARFSLRGLCRG